MNNSYYNDTVENFLKSSNEEVLGKIVSKAPRDIEELQKRAWEEQILILKRELTGLEGHIHFEFSIPRINRRLDNILIVKDIIFVLEFKTGRIDKNSSCLQQAWDYALDLKYFHAETHDKKIVPIAVTHSSLKKTTKLEFHPDMTSAPINITYELLNSSLIEILTNHASTDHISISKWNTSSYKPTPTIIEAAKYIYREHEVDSITRKDASGANLSVTLGQIELIIKNTKTNNQKSICLITGVPGAGKTLIGLDLALTNEHNGGENTVYLSGNRPLVEILKSSLAKDRFQQEKSLGSKIRKKEIEQKLDGVIQNIHNFRDQYIDDSNAPHEHIVIFDEAQRVWDTEKTYEFLLEKNKVTNEDKAKSEPEMLIEIMDRHKEWCCVVCLIGGGQEIHTGEAGLDGWLKLFQETFKNWNVYLSSEIVKNPEYSWKGIIKDLIADKNPNINIQDDLHLSVSQRSFRADNLSQYVGFLLENEIEKAREVYKAISHKYPIHITRDLQKAKDWLRKQRRGSERMGLLASSEGQRLRPHGLVLDRRGIDYNCWYLNPDEDIRSSNFLELPATEFESQGLEIDWACVCWDTDLRRENDVWAEYVLKGSTWKKPSEELKKVYLRNAYRVILTRARQGIIIFVPHGDLIDSTRSPVHYDEIYDVLLATGIEEIVSTY